MFALLAAIVFLLSLLHVSLGSVDLTTLGLFLLSLHLIVPVGPRLRD